MKLIRAIYSRIVNMMYLDRLHTREIRMWEELYGEFDKTNYKSYRIEGLPNESGACSGVIAKWAQDMPSLPHRVLLAGEKRNVVKYLGFLGEEIYTAGLSGADFEWNFENDPPYMDKFDLIISQAVLEHLLNPYKHLSDLAGLTDINGHMIVHGAGIRMPYHRYPIDTCRFHPDWFEEAASKLKMRIVKRSLNRYLDLVYMFQKVQ